MNGLRRWGQYCPICGAKIHRILLTRRLKWMWWAAADVLIDCSLFRAGHFILQSYLKHTARLLTQLFVSWGRKDHAYLATLEWWMKEFIPPGKIRLIGPTALDLVPLFSEFWYLDPWPATTLVSIALTALVATSGVKNEFRSVTSVRACPMTKTRGTKFSRR